MELVLTSANSPDHLDFRLFIFCSHSPNLEEFTVSFISRWKFIFLFFEKAVEFLAYANFLDHLDFRLFIFGSHSRNQDEFTVSFISKQKFILLFFEKAVWILAYANILDHLNCSHGALAVFYLRKQISLPINEGSLWNLPL